MNSSTAQTLETEFYGSVVEKDRRRAPRQPVEVTGWISAEAATRGASQRVEVIDFSLHGVGFISETGFHKDAIHWIVVGTQNGGLRASSRMRIAFCRERADSQFECGAEFF